MHFYHVMSEKTIEKQRWIQAAVSLCVSQARVHGEEQTSSRPAEGAQIRD